LQRVSHYRRFLGILGGWWEWGSSTRLRTMKLAASCLEEILRRNVVTTSKALLRFAREAKSCVRAQSPEHLHDLRVVEYEHKPTFIVDGLLEGNRFCSAGWVAGTPRFVVGSRKCH